MDVQAGLGAARDLELPAGTIRYRDVGTGPTLVFVHGIFASGVLWRDVVPALVDRFRCIVPDLPLGGHALPLYPGVDRSPTGMARLLAAFLAALDLRDVTLVGNDTGGAICQIMVTQQPERIAGLVLTNCDAYEAFFPWLIKPFTWGARLIGDRFGGMLAAALRYRLTQRLLLWPVTRRHLDAATLDAYYGSFLRTPGAQSDLVHFLAAVSNRDTLAAAAAFPRFPHPVLIAWGESDFIFPASTARRLQQDFPHAELRFIPNSRAFVPEDQPARLAELIAEFVPDRVVAVA